MYFACFQGAHLRLRVTLFEAKHLYRLRGLCRHAEARQTRTEGGWRAPEPAGQPFNGYKPQPFNGYKMHHLLHEIGMGGGFTFRNAMHSLTADAPSLVRRSILPGRFSTFPERLHT